MLEVWASHLGWADDELLGKALPGEVIPLRAGKTTAPAAPMHDAGQETPLRRAAAQRDAR